MDDDGGNVFQGALALVEMMLEIGYHSPGCTNEQPPVDSCSTGMKTLVPEGASPFMVAGPDAQFDSHLQTNLTGEPNGKKVQYPRRIEDEPDLLDDQAVCQVADQVQKGGDQPSPPLPHVGYEIGLEERPFPERDTSLAGADWREESSIPDGGINGLHTDNVQPDRTHGVEHVHRSHAVMHASGDNLLVTINGDHQYAAMPALRPRAGFPFDRGRQVMTEDDG